MADFRFSPPANGLANDFVWSIYGDTDGTLWLATNGGGLAVSATGNSRLTAGIRGFTTMPSLQILDDKLGHLWMSSNKGVFSVSKKQLDAFADGRVASITSTAYGTADGMKSRECNGGFPACGLAHKRWTPLLPDHERARDRKSSQPGRRTNAPPVVFGARSR